MQPFFPGAVVRHFFVQLPCSSVIKSVIQGAFIGSTDITDIYPLLNNGLLKELFVDGKHFMTGYKFCVHLYVQMKND